MKPIHSIFQIMLWIAVGVIITGIIIVGILTNITLRSIEKNLPVTLLKQLHSLTMIHEEIAEIVLIAERTKLSTTPDNFNKLREKVDRVYQKISELRNTYVIDNLIYASAFHTIVAPAIADLQIWLSEGVSGYAPESDVTVLVVLDRITEVFEKSKQLNFNSQITAQKMLNDQRKRIDKFIFSANLLLALTIVMIVGMVYLLIRQYILHRYNIQAKVDLQYQRDLLNTLFDHILLGITVWNHDGTLMKVNKYFSELTGYSLEDIQDVDTWFLKAYPDPSYRAHVIEDWKKSIKQQSAVREFKICCKNQKIKDIEFRGAFLPDGRALVTMSDISERKLTEEFIRQSENRFRAIFERAPVGMAIIDENGHFIEINAQMCNILGYRLDELADLSMDVITHYLDRDRNKEVIRQLIKREIDFNQEERRFIHKDGHTIWAIISNTLIHRDSQHPSFLLCHILDITIQKQAQEEKARLERQLHQAQKLEAIGTLAGGIAHDFNNLLMGIQGRTTLILLHLKPSDPNYEHVKFIEQYVQTAADLTKKILGVAREGKYDIKPIDINELIRSCASLFSRSTKEIRVQTDLETSLHTVHADRRQMELVLMNMFENAKDAMPQGGDILVKTRNVLFDDVTCLSHQIKPGHYVSITITDTGIGMDETTRQRIFDPFFTTKPKARGTGLGLSSAYGIIKNHGGTITVQSEKGKGTSFNIFLPSS